MAIRRDRNGQIEEVDEQAEKPTRLIKRGGDDKQPPAEKDLAPRKRGTIDQHTQLYGADTVEGLNAGEQRIPVVGWLVIIAGPGRGRALTLGYGTNGIGRGPESRVQLDFGDMHVSRENHAVISYDPRGRRFYLQHGGGTNLTYLNEQPVLAPTELQGGEIISLGHTRLHFVPFCGPAFDWQDSDAGTT